jgi:pilus assembly protein Flp/PilA
LLHYVRYHSIAVAPLCSKPLRFGESLDSAREGSKLNRETIKGDLQMINMLKNLHKEESGQDLIEYGLIALIVALGAIVGMGSLAKSINQVFTQVAAQLT